MRRKTPWFSIASGIVACLLILGQVVAYGKQQAETEQVREDVKALKEDVEEQDQELQQQQLDQRAIQQDLGYLKEGVKVLLERKR